MALIKKRFPAPACNYRGVYGLIPLLFLLAFPLFSQNKPVLITVEIASIEKKLSDSKLSPAERKSALETMARLFELSGNAEGAAEAWLEAARAVPGNAGHGNLLQSARCLASMGEFDKAAAVIKPVLADSTKTLKNSALLLSAQAEALKTGNIAPLNSLLSNPDFAEKKPALYYSIWKISSDPSVQSSFASRLLSEFPQSPEARIVRDDALVSAAPSALWLLLGVGQGPVTASASQGSAGTPSSAAQTPAIPAVTSPVVTTNNPSGGPVMLQTGLFSLEENAKNLASRLQAAGFNAVIAKKAVNGKDHFTVGVLPGADPSQTMLLLKDRGFESFPVYQ